MGRREGGRSDGEVGRREGDVWLGVYTMLGALAGFRLYK